LACPFFMPTRRSEEGVWIHPSRLPLGCGWEGHCTAPGYEGTIPDIQQLQDACNLGYANCSRLPQQRAWDAVRFAVSGEQESHISLSYVCEKNHLPCEHGQLEYVVPARQWVTPHGDPRVQRMAECFVEVWLRKTRSQSDRQDENLHERN
jgi:hypothetical protein